MSLHRAVADDEGVGNLSIREPACDEREDLELARR
jgi:hypothetical protein